MSSFTFGFNVKPRIVALGGGGYDTDASAFFTAAGITDTTQKSAINQLVLDLKSANIWTKMKAVYPFVGGTSTTHKFNLVNPLDSDAAYRLSFSTGWVHDSNGILGNGSSTYADTFLNTSTVFPSNTLSIGGYVNSNLTFDVARYIIGSYTTSTSSMTRLYFLNSTQFRSHLAVASASSIVVNYNKFQGFHGTSRTANNNTFAVNSDGTYTSNTNTATLVATNLNSYIGALNAATVSGYWNDYIKFIFYADPLSQSEMTNMRTAVINFETTLSRN